MTAVQVRHFRAGDGVGVARISRENGAYYARLAPEHFREPDEEGLVALVEEDGEWRHAPENLALVAEVEDAVAGYLEASIQPPLETARWQTQRDLGAVRLFSTFVGTADRYKRMGVATRLVEAAEEWGRSQGAVVAVCDTFIDSPLSVPFWEERMGYDRRAVCSASRCSSEEEGSGSRRSGPWPVAARPHGPGPAASAPAGCSCWA